MTLKNTREIRGKTQELERSLKTRLRGSVCFLQRRTEAGGVLQPQPATQGAKQKPAGHHRSPGGQVETRSGPGPGGQLSCRLERFLELLKRYLGK